jgi:hypothetical protein
MALLEHAVKTLTDAELARVAELVRVEMASRAARRAEEATKSVATSPLLPPDPVLLPPPGFTIIGPQGRSLHPPTLTTRPKRGSPPTQTLFIENVPKLDDTMKAELVALLERHGRIQKFTGVKIAGRQVIFATYASLAQAETAKVALDGISFRGDFIRVRFRPES